MRETVLSSLDSRFDNFLAQSENLRCLFFALNDEVFRIRELAVITLGRQAKRNPAYILPSLRKVLLKVCSVRVRVM
jgi:serine/threonine-protein kinase mTOR